MTFKLLLGESFGWTLLFFVLVIFAVFTQHPMAKSVPYGVRGPVKAAPAFLLATVSWHFQGPTLLTIAFLLCGCGHDSSIAEDAGRSGSLAKVSGGTTRA